jgi:hypothetical protein
MSTVDFTELGLSRNEAKAYETLLHLGKASAGQLSKQSGVPYGRIYDVLASLEHKHLIRIVPEETRQYVPTDPEQLDELIAERMKKLTETQVKIKELHSLYAQQEQPAVQVITGRGTFYKITRSFPKAEKRSYSIKYGFDPHPEFVRENKVMKQKKIEHLTLGRIDNETRKNVEIFKKINPRIKQITNEGIAWSLIDDKAMWIVLIKSNATLVIRDKPFIDMMAELFKFYYEHH